MEEGKKRTDRKSQGMRSQYLGALPNEEPEELMPLEDDFEEDIKIRDAVTDKTIVSLEEVQNIRDAAKAAEEEDDLVKIRDAVTDKTIVSVTQARTIRDAVRMTEAEDDEDDLVKIHDAVTDKTIVSVTQARAIRDAATQILPEDDFIEVVNLRDAASEAKVEKEPEPLPAETKQPSQAESFDINDFITKEPEKPEEEEALDINAFITAEPEVSRKEKKSARPKKQAPPARKERQRTQEPAYEPPRASRRRDAYYEDDYYYDDRQYDYDDYDSRYDDDRYAPRKSPLRFVPLVLVIALCVFGFVAAKEVCFDVPVNANDFSKFSYTITGKPSNEQVAEDLLSMGLIDNPLVYRLRCILYSADYKEGTYQLSPCYSTEKIINILSGYEYITDD